VTDDRPEFSEVQPDDDVKVQLVEPLTAARSSPHSIASLIVAALALYGAPRYFFPVPLLSASAAELASSLVGIATELALAIVALWLARAADDEIADSDGRLGGVGFAKTGRILAVIAIAAAVVSLGLQFVPERAGGAVLENIPASVRPAEPPMPQPPVVGSPEPGVTVQP
jgi:hypothetical protein